ncbi:uncharacterized protein FYN16_007147 isoform 2-T3 [Cariama cristata]
MKMCKTIPVFILLFTGYVCNNMDVAANTTTSLGTFPTTSEVAQPPELETTHESDHVPEKDLSAVLVAGISISFIVLLILVIIGVWCARKRSKGGSAEMSSVPSGEPEVFLQRISTREPTRVAF